MALKDWKKEMDNSLYTIWLNKTKRGKVYVSKRKGNPKVNKRQRTGYLVSVWIYGISEEKRKVFKTKAQAIKYAKNYMRKH